METVGTILSIDGSLAVVDVKRISGCTGDCKDCAGCETKSVQVSAYTDLDVSIGDQVRIASDRNAVLFGLFVLFILPLFVPTVMYFLTAGSGMGGWFAGGALVLVLLFIWQLSRSPWYLKKTRPYIVEVLSEGER